MSKLSPSIDRLQAFLLEAAPAGKTRPEVSSALGMKKAAACSAIVRALRNGRIFAIKGHGTALYFARKEDADRMDIGEFVKSRVNVLTPTRSPLQFAIAEHCKTRVFGATQLQIRQAVGVGRDLLTTVVACMVRDKRLFAVGPVVWRRYFETAERAEQMREETLVSIDAERAASKIDQRERRQRYSHERWLLKKAQQPERVQGFDPSRAWRQAQIIEACTASTRGLSLSDICDVTNASKEEAVKALWTMVHVDRIFFIGPRGFRRYFATKEQMRACHADAMQAISDERKARLKRVPAEQRAPKPTVAKAPSKKPAKATSYNAPLKKTHHKQSTDRKSVV